ncbi:hypothetical protein A8C32_16300 [Flavivirga aquatica]|uniref:Lipocalin-like domain-containing protein n=2 Tax=Flavivirga aquatica TaxID=1849968 RepID=A0A1E5T9N0_9FLAO|nr:hypothetical protein A8C32_16300 [Flavivirga aquatica]
MKLLLLMPLFTLLLFTSCQDEVTEITEPNENETLVANSELTSLMLSTSKMDGSVDNIIDKASCLSVDLPVTVKVNGLEIKINSREDFRAIELIFNEFEGDEDTLDIIFPVTIVLADYTEVVIQNSDALGELIKDCKGENEEDDDIECIDFQYPISFSVFDKEFQIVDVANIESDRALHRFIKRVKNAEVVASLNFPVTMVLADETTIEVNNNIELGRTIKEVKDTCDEDDDNDYGDDDFTEERLDNLLKTCPWVVYEFERNQNNLNDSYRDYVMVFKEDNVVKVHARNEDILTGTWITRITDRGALIKLEFDTLVDFTLEWVVYDLEPGRIKFYENGGNKIILKKNCDIVIDVENQNKEIKGYLSNCLWRVKTLNISGSAKEEDYIGNTLHFFSDNSFSIDPSRLEYGSYTVFNEENKETILKITLDNQNTRTGLEIKWTVVSASSNEIIFKSGTNEMVLVNHCKKDNNDINYIINDGEWVITLYEDGTINKTDDYSNYIMDFLPTGRVSFLYDNRIQGAWFAYNEAELYFDFNAGTEEAPLGVLKHRWRIEYITQDRIELKDFNSNGLVERVLILEKTI